MTDSAPTAGRGGEKHHHYRSAMGTAMTITEGDNAPRAQRAVDDWH